MNQEEFEAAMRGADLLERERWREEMEEPTAQMHTAKRAEEEGVTLTAKILALIVLVAVLPVFVHALVILGSWSWNLIG